KIYYFGAGITATRLPLYLSVQLGTVAHDQGLARHPEEGPCSWFELAISPRTSVTDSQVKKDPNGKPLTWNSHDIPLNSTHTTQTGLVFGKDHESWKHLDDGDYIGVLGCAKDDRWECDARSDKLSFLELVIDKPA
ncbi:hypothetical protein BDV93DRAFT_448792, partial [Ceratobasidium sp. AG-I]